MNFSHYIIILRSFLSIFLNFICHPIGSPGRHQQFWSKQRKLFLGYSLLSEIYFRISYIFIKFSGRNEINSQHWIARWTKNKKNWTRLEPGNKWAGRQGEEARASQLTIRSHVFKPRCADACCPYVVTKVPTLRWQHGNAGYPNPKLKLKPSWKRWKSSCTSKAALQNSFGWVLHDLNWFSPASAIKPW